MPHKDPAARAAWYKRHYAKNKGKIRAQARAARKKPGRLAKETAAQKKWRAVNREKVAANGRRLRRTQAEKKAGRAKSDYCEACGAGGRICLDHDHKTGLFRGWLCDRCNRGIGFLNDDPGLLRTLAAYLDRT